ncbi:MAG: nuclear transport factor 2 family protein [Pseudomonadota bacterium]
MQFRAFFISLCVVTALPACTVNLNVNDTQLLGTEITKEDRIRTVLSMQQDAWNTGDIDGFMQGYWQSPELRFASGGTVTRGWQATRDRYHANYSDRSLMGTLTFEAIETLMLSDDAAVVHGAWALQRESDRPSGLFTLVFQQIDGDWKIVSDTTTSAD